MQQVNLTDQLYQEAQRRATEAGFASVDEYVASILSSDYEVVNEELDHFSPPSESPSSMRLLPTLRRGRSILWSRPRKHWLS